METNNNYIGSDLLELVRKADNPFEHNGNVVGLPFNLEDVISIHGKEIIPDCLGIYHLFYNDQLVYIGMSKNIRGRLLGHMKDKDMPFNNVLWFVARNWKQDATIEDVLRAEYKMIKYFKPVLNSVHANCR